MIRDSLAPSARAKVAEATGPNKQAKAARASRATEPESSDYAAPPTEHPADPTPGKAGFSRSCPIPVFVSRSVTETVAVRSPWSVGPVRLVSYGPYAECRSEGTSNVHWAYEDRLRTLLD